MRAESTAQSVDEDIRVAASAAEATLSIAGVHSLGYGHYVEAATYGAGEKVLGVIADSTKVEVHVVALYPPAPEHGSLIGLAQKVRQRVSKHAGGREVSVVVDDVAEGERA